MTQQITVRLSDAVIEALDEAARHSRGSRAEVIRQAVEHYLEDFDDLSVAVTRLQDTADQILDWDVVRREILASN